MSKPQTTSTKMRMMELLACALLLGSAHAFTPPAASAFGLRSSATSFAPPAPMVLYAAASDDDDDAGDDEPKVDANGKGDVPDLFKDEKEIVDAAPESEASEEVKSEEKSANGEDEKEPKDKAFDPEDLPAPDEYKSFQEADAEQEESDLMNMVPEFLKPLVEGFMKPGEAGSGGGMVKTEEQDFSEVQEFVETTLEVAIDVTLQILVSLRWTAANILTQSLPEDEKKELLSRMQPELPKQKTGDDVESTVRGSVQEEIAAASIVDARDNSKQWEKEKKKLTKEMGDAATERVKNELAIQKQRLEKEMADTTGSMEADKKQLEEEKKTLSEQIQNLRDQMEKDTEAAAKAETAKEEQTAEVAAKAEEATAEEAAKAEKAKEELKALEALLEKRELQQGELAKVETDLKERLQQVQQEKEQLSELSQQVDKMKEQSIEQVPYYTPIEYRGLSDEEKAKLKQQRDAAGRPAATEGDAHPVLGPVVSDLGYKRVHLVSSGKLGTIPIWKKQRTYRNSRAISMAKDKSKTLNLGFPGIISLHEDVDGKLSIIDGQHRVGMMQALREKRNSENESGKDTLLNWDDSMFDQVLVEVYPEEKAGDDSKEHAKEVFLEINKAEPIQLVDIPGVAPAKDRNIINDAVARLEKDYKPMFSESQRCRSPNVNMDNMRNQIFGAGILKRHKLTTSKKLVDWLLEQNAAVGAKFEQEEWESEYHSAKALNKAQQNEFYLGLETSWLYN